MGRTPDRHPGILYEDEEIVLSETAIDPDVVGAIRRVGGDLKAKDSLGVFNLRTGGSGITEEQHRLIDQLVHNVLDEDNYEEYTYTTGKVTNVTVWETSAKLKKIREYQYTYATGKVSQEVMIQYDATGVAVEHLTGTYSWSGSNLSNVTWVRTVP